MKTKLLFLLSIILSLNLSAQTTVNLTMNPSYSDMVYYKLNTEAETHFTANSWDIAFWRQSAFDTDIRNNAHQGIEVFEASNNPADWNSIDLANESNWTQLYDSTTQWATQVGAYSNGSATFGYGEMNFGTNHLEGTIIFVLKYPNGDYVKFINEDYFFAYTFKYAKWNTETSTWNADQTVTIPNANNPNNRFNYYSFQNDQEVVAAPAIADWDFVFTRYTIDFFGDGTFYQPVTGVLHNSTVQVAQNTESDTDPLPSSLSYSNEINTIGYDWKAFGGSGFNVDSNERYYVKYENGTIYRLYFTEFGGSATGNISFVFDDVTTSLGIENITENVSFGLYPNPTKNKKVSLIYNVNTLNTNNEIIIYNINGVKVYHTPLNNNSGFYNKNLDLSNLENGIYMLQFISGNVSVTKKLILK